MTDRKLSETIHILLHNPRFVMWCMMPTEELDCEWQQWLELHPEDQQAVDQARAILRSVRLNDFHIFPDKSEQLWMRLEQSMLRKQTNRRIIFIRYAAACIVALFLSITGLELFNKFGNQNSVANINRTSDTTHTEVMLIMDDDNTVQVEDNALIAYNSEVIVKGKAKEEKVIKKIIIKGAKEDEDIAMNTLVVPKGRRSSILLPDGSKAWMNSGSVLRFPSHFETDHRTIELEGEIYIEVAKSKIPFYVKTDGFTVHVLGTKFNISAYTDEPASSVVLVEGSVQVNMLHNQKIALTPNRMLTIEAGEKRIEDVDVYDYISWKDGLLQFKGETLDNILKRLSRYYNISIKCKPGIEYRRSSGKLVLFDDIHQLMETFSMLYNTQYHFESDTLIIE